VLRILEVNAISVGATGRGADTDIADSYPHASIELEVGLGTVPHLDVLNRDIATLVESESLKSKRKKGE
jgi:hypothetical protein